MNDIIIYIIIHNYIRYNILPLMNKLAALSLGLVVWTFAFYSCSAGSVTVKGTAENPNEETEKVMFRGSEPQL